MSFPASFSLVLCSGLFYATVHAAEIPGGEITAESERIVAAQNAIKSLDITYVAKTSPAGSSKTFTYIDTHYIAKDSMRRRQSLHWTDQRPASIDTNNLIQVFNNDHFNVYYLPSRMCEVSSKAVLTDAPWKVKTDLVLDCLGWWPEADTPPPMADDVVWRQLRYSVADNRYSFEPPDYCDGARCTVLSFPGRDKVWLDPELGYAIRKRQTYDRSTGHLRRSQISSDFEGVQCASGGSENIFWVPRKISIEAFDSNPSSPESRRIEINIRELKANSVSDADFVLEMQPGTMVHDVDSGATYCIPGGIDLLDRTIDMANIILTLTPSRRVASAGEAPSFVVLVVIGFAFAAFLVSRYFKFRLLYFVARG